MYLFFAEITGFALCTIIILAFLSVVIKNFWCRYLCPYGALLGAVSWLSPFKVTRNVETRIDCELCTKACPSAIKVHKAKRVWSDECMSCYQCIEVCPVKDALIMSTQNNEEGNPGLGLCHPRHGRLRQHHRARHAQRALAKHDRQRRISQAIPTVRFPTLPALSRRGARVWSQRLTT